MIKIKIILIRPPRIYYQESLGLDVGIQRTNLPLGLMYIGAVLQKHDYSVQIIDCLISEDTALRRDGDYIFHGLESSCLINKIKQTSPDIVGVGIDFTAQAEPALEAIIQIKRAFPSVKIVVGGCDATVRATELLKNNEIDFIILGEGETSFLELVQSLEDNCSIQDINGIAFRDNGEIKINPARLIDNIDSIPLPAYNLVDLDLYFKRRSLLKKQWDKVSIEKTLFRFGKKILMRDRWKDMKDITVITSRGCPFNCTFCSIHLQFGKKFRAHSPEYVIKHLELLVNEYGVEYIHFEDDNISLNMKRFERILDAIIERKLKFRWDIPNGLRADRLNRKIIQKMKNAGCEEITVGVESGDQNVLDNIIHKAIKLEDIEKTLRICKEERISTSAFYVIGMPGETKENIESTIRLAHDWEKNMVLYRIVVRQHHCLVQN